MSESRTTELLREGLTERGIEWRSGLEGVTFVGDWCFVEYDNGRLAATCEPVLTPDQAIAATLGSGTCENIAPDYLDFLCSKCGFVHYHSDENDIGDGNDWNYCPYCGAKVVSANES